MPTTTKSLLALRTLFFLGAFLAVPAFAHASPMIISGPTTSSSIIYTLSWNPSGEVAYVQELRPGGSWTTIYSGTGSSMKVKRVTGIDYQYRGAHCASTSWLCYDWGKIKKVTVPFPPGIPALSLNTTSGSGRYTVSWNPSYSSTVDRYELFTNVDGGVWAGPEVFLPSAPLNLGERKTENGNYGYQVRACNVYGCSGYSQKTIAVDLQVADVIADAPVVNLAVPAQQNVGAIEAQSGVDGGAGQYSIPIKMAPGRAGMSPKVSLNYNSRSGNGTVGVGWSVSGGSRIHRCPRTEGQDGVTRAVNFGMLGPDQNDRLCLDGVRLILIAGTYGFSGSEYRTEVDQFVRITLPKGDIDVPGSYFKVEHKNGRTSYYGAYDGSNSVQIPMGQTSPLGWMIDLVEDKQGNFLRYQYVQDDGAILLTDIYYTGTTILSTLRINGNRHVSFIYEQRPDINTSYLSGTAARNKQRLIEINTFASGQLVRHYALTYVQSGATERSLLSQINEGVNPSGAGSGLALRATTFSYQDEAIAYAPQADLFGLVGEEFVAHYTNDYDGDGRRDILVFEYPEPWGGGTPISRKLYLSSRRGTPIDLSRQSWFADFDAEADGRPTPQDTDFNNDGRADLIGTVEGKLAFGTWNGRGFVSEVSTYVPSTMIFKTGDFNGDGKTDLSFRVNGQRTIELQCGQSPLEFCTASVAVTLNDYETVKRIADFDGNGLDDFYIDWNNYSDPSFATARIVYSHPKSNGGIVFTATNLPSALHFADSAGFFQANRDGLLDLYYFTSGGLQVYINQGDDSPFLSVSVSGVYDIAHPKLRGAVFTMDYDGDGREDLMMPVGAPTHRYCYDDILGGEGMFWCGTALLNNSEFAHLDRSFYMWSAVRFNERADGSFAIDQVTTALELPVFAARAQDTGDGIVDAVYKLGLTYAQGPHGTSPSSRYSSMPGSTFGPKVVKSLGANAAADGGASDLMASATDGVGRMSTWEYRPLSSQGSAACPSYQGRPYYQADFARDRDGVHHFFSSTMHVAARFEQSNGVGGMNASCYRYENAIYNSQGRGFLGFEAITVEQDLVDDPQNNLRTTTYFHQQFPLAGRVLGTRTELTSDPVQPTPNSWETPVFAIGCYDPTTIAPDDKPLARTSRIWRANCAPNGTCFPYVCGETTETRDLITRDVLSTVSQSTSYSAADLAYGNLTSAVVVTDDPTMTHTMRTSSVYDYSNVGNWWLNKKTESTATSEAVVHKSAPLPATTENNDKTIVTATTWYPENDPWARLPASNTVQPGSPTEETRTDFVAYDAFGNATMITQSAANLTTPRTTQVTYTSDGYFPATTTNPMGHATSTVTDPESGQPFSQTLYGVTTTTSYDELHRVLSVDTDGAPIAYTRLLWCGTECPTNAVWKLQSIQDGSPITTQFMDRLDRPIKATTTAFDGTETTMVTAFNTRGQTVRQSEPSSNPNGAYFTEFSNFDALGRVGQKVVDRQGHAFGTFTTNYSYDGLTTQIDLPDALTAYRSYNSRKQLVTTTDTDGSQSHFRQDGLGNQVLIEDSAGNQTLFRFNNVGHRMWISDPDQGESTYVYNGLGELTAQTDANNKTLSFVYDDIGRMVSRDVDGTAESVWIFDTITQGTLYAEANMAELVRYYSYDALLRPTTTRTTTDGMEFVVEQAYDGYYGRAKGMRYPSGEMVKFAYNDNGYATGEHNPLGPDQAEIAYRTVAAMDARGNVTEQSYGNGLIAYNEFYASTGRPKSIYIPDPNPNATTAIQHLTYAFDDPFANMTEQQNVAQGVTETFLYDNLRRLTTSTRTWASATEVVNYSYNALGNITLKDDYAQAYSYGASGKNNAANAGPHAVVGYTPLAGATVADFSYDNNGNQLTGDGRTVSYNAFNKPVTIARDGVTTSFEYGPSLARFRRVSPEETTYYVGKLHEYVINNGAIEQRDYVSDYLVLTHDGTSRSLSYVHIDRLGSTDVITDENGTVVESHGYDPFGKPRDGTWGDSNEGLLSSSVGNRGFTSHEHVDEQQLIHMNGRVYDYNLGRFLSVDPFIQNIANTQAMNPYSYVLNNPLMATDPTGYVCEDDCEPDADTTDVGEDNIQKGVTNNGGLAQHEAVHSGFLSKKAVDGAGNIINEVQIHDLDNRFSTDAQRDAAKKQVAEQFARAGVKMKVTFATGAASTQVDVHPVFVVDPKSNRQREEVRTALKERATVFTKISKNLDSRVDAMRATGTWGKSAVGETGGFALVDGPETIQRGALVTRTANVVTHEVGHILGLWHTKGDAQNAMFSGRPANSVQNFSSESLRTYDADGLYVRDQVQTTRLREGAQRRMDIGQTRRKRGAP